MKILYVGVYRDSTGWSEAAIRYILALDAAGHEVVCRPLKLNDADHRPPERVLELEARSSRGCDAVIQNVLPHHMDYSGPCGLNVGLYFSETDTLRHCSWNDRLNQMDLLVGPNRQMYDAARESFVEVPFEVVGVPCDPAGYAQDGPVLPEIDSRRQAGGFVFYTIGEMTRRKNLAALLYAFHTEFDPNEPVELVVKTSRQGMPPGETRKHVLAFCERIKEGLKLYRGNPAAYKQEIVITERLSGDEVLALHRSCDCFVQPGYGEAWSIPAFDAMAMGKTPIVTDCTGYREYVTPETGQLVGCSREQVFGVDDSFTDLFVGKELWYAADHVALRRAMRTAYEGRGPRPRAGIEKAAEFSYARLGKRLGEVLESHERQKKAAAERLAATA